MADGSVVLEQAVADSPFVETPAIRSLLERALTYLRCGLAVHFSGPAGTGKTTLALQVAGRLGRPVILVQGDDLLTSADLVGGVYGYRRVRVVDNYVRSVWKTQEDVWERWTDNRLTIACRKGYTLVYDEFTRSRPEANNVLLSVLEERLLTLPAPWGEKGYVRVHADFRAIFTSNPDEYAGVHRAQDALRNRMVTIHLEGFDPETEAAIVAARTGLDPGEAAALVEAANALGGEAAAWQAGKLRRLIALGLVLAASRRPVNPADAVFRETFLDVFAVTPGERRLLARRLEELGRAGSPARAGKAAGG